MARLTDQSTSVRPDTAVVPIAQNNPIIHASGEAEQLLAKFNGHAHALYKKGRNKYIPGIGDTDLCDVSIGYKVAQLPAAPCHFAGVPVCRHHH